MWQLSRRARSSEAERVDEEPGQLLDAEIEVAIHEALHEPHFGEAVRHGSESGGGNGGVEVLVREPVLLQAAYGVRDLRRRDVVAFVAEGTQVVVEARDLFDHAHDAGFVPIALEVPPDTLVDPLVR